MDCSCVIWKSRISLRWRHNGHDGVSNHQHHDCLLNRLFRRRPKKHQSSASLAFLWGIQRRPVNSPHKWPVTRKMFPFDDVIMWWWSMFVRKTSYCRIHIIKNLAEIFIVHGHHHLKFKRPENSQFSRHFLSTANLPFCTDISVKYYPFVDSSF